MIRLAKLLREGDHRSVAGHFIVFAPLRGSDESRIEYLAIMLLDGFRSFLDQSFHAFALTSGFPVPRIEKSPQPISGTPQKSNSGLARKWMASSSTSCRTITALPTHPAGIAFCLLYGYRWFRIGGLDYLLKRSEILAFW